MKKIYNILYILFMLLHFPACSSASEEPTEIINYTEKTDSISGEKDSKAEKTDSIPGINNSEGETLSSQDEELPDTIFKLEEYIQLHRGNNYAEGAALYGDYLFQASLNSELHIYNFSEKKYVTSIKLPSVGHADTMCFGTETVDENDEFPVLYISGSNAYKTGRKGTIYVYRLLREKNEQGTENWSGILIQCIKTPDVAVVGSYPDIVIDEKGNCMWIIGWFQKMGYNVSDGSGCTYIFSKYKTPSITDGTKDKKGVYQLVLSEDNRQSYFLLYDVHAITQGLCFYNGIIICPYGKPAVSYKGIDFVDVNKQQLVANVDLAKSLINEAEAAVVVEGNLYLVGQKSYVYKCIDFNLSAFGNY